MKVLKFLHTLDRMKSIQKLLCYSTHQRNSGALLSIVKASTDNERKKLTEIVESNLVVYEDFVNNEEEQCIVNESSRSFRKKKYEYGHWDGAIEGYRELEKSTWLLDSQLILDRMRTASFQPDETLQPYTHVLDLAKNGYIKPHIDSVKFCGSKIVGLCLLSAAIMRFVKSENENSSIEVLLPRYSLYIMCGALRYDFTHEVLSSESSYWNGKHVPRDRRLTILMRTNP